MPRRDADSRVPSKDLGVGQVAKRSGVAISTIHFYEAKGLIKSWRTTGNQRRYPREVLRRIAVIRVAQRVGLPLQAIRKALLTLPKARTPSARDWAEMSRLWSAELDNRIHTLMKLRDELTKCIGCGCLSLDACPLYNRDDKLSREGPGPRLLDPT